MSRVSTLEKLMMDAQPKQPFSFEKLSTIPISCLFSSKDIDDLLSVATSIKYNANIQKKYDLLDEIMRRRYFVKAHSGTNRRIYRFLEDPSFVAKVAVDKIGMKDSPQEYIHQVKFQPFCCKIFEVHPSGVIAFVEKVNPITSLEEMLSIADDVFDLMATKVVGKYVVDDLGTKTFMNFGVRPGFGPVIIDFPYVYELDSKKLICHNKINDNGVERECGGDIDIIAGFNGYHCIKCGREYKAIDLAKESVQNFNLFEWDKNYSSPYLKKLLAHFRSKVVDKLTGKTILDSGRKSDVYLSKEDCDIMQSYNLPAGTIEVGKTIKEKRVPAQEMRLQYYSELQRQAMEKQVKVNSPTIRDIVEGTGEELVEVAKVIKEPPFDDSKYDTPKPLIDEYNSVDGPATQEVVVDDSDDVVIESANTLQAAPELPAVEVAHEAIIQKMPDVKPASKPIPGQVYSDEQVKAMADEVASHNVEIADNESGDSEVIDPEQDKEHPEISPMTRPYANAKESVYVGAKMEVKHKTVEAPKVNMESIKPMEEPAKEEEPTEEPEEALEEAVEETTEPEKTEVGEPEMEFEAISEEPTDNYDDSDSKTKVIEDDEDDEDESSEEDEEQTEGEEVTKSEEPVSNIPDVMITDPESPKAYRKADYNYRKKNSKRRNAYDDEDE